MVIRLDGGSVGGEYGSCWRLMISRGNQVTGPTAISMESVGESLIENFVLCPIEKFCLLCKQNVFPVFGSIIVEAML
jgi:hypothetical protein